MPRRSAYNPLLKSYPDSDKINAVSEGAECLYCRLIAQADDAGRYPAEPAWVLGKLFTARMAAGQLRATEVARRLDELESVGLIHRYESDGRQYLEIVDVFRTSRADVRPQLLYPQPVPVNGTDTGRTRAEHVTNTARTRNEHVTLEQEQEQEQEPLESANADSCPERSANAAGPPTVESAPPMAFPVKGPQPSKLWRLPVAKLAEYAEAYPAVDLMAELRAAQQWLRDNPTRQKTPGGMLRFLNRWLAKAQNEARAPPQRGRAAIDWDEVARKASE